MENIVDINAEPSSRWSSRIRQSWAQKWRISTGWTLWMLTSILISRDSKTERWSTLTSPSILGGLCQLGSSTKYKWAIKSTTANHIQIRYPDITLEDIGVIDTISVGQLNDWISAFPEMVNNGQSNNIESISKCLQKPFFSSPSSIKYFLHFPKSWVN